MIAKLDHIRGYCVIWNARSEPIYDNDGNSFIESVDRGACSWPKTCATNYHHSARTNFASVAEGGLRIWEDETGVAFEAEIPSSLEGAGLRSLLAQPGRTWGVSPYFNDLRHKTIIETDATKVERVVAAEISHVSITAEPAYPATSCWLASMPPERLAPQAQQAALRWRFGQLPPAARPQVSARLPPAPRHQAQAPSRPRFSPTTDILNLPWSEFRAKYEPFFFWPPPSARA